MNPNDPNLAMVEAVAEPLGALRERLVFVGGCAGGLLITDPALPAIRATEDVDVAVEVATLADYMSHDLGDVLAVIDGREELLAEFENADAELASFVGGMVLRLLASAKFATSLAGHLPGDRASQERLPELEAKLARLAALAKP